VLEFKGRWEARCTVLWGAVVCVSISVRASFLAFCTLYVQSYTSTQTFLWFLGIGKKKASEDQLKKYRDAREHNEKWKSNVQRMRTIAAKLENAYGWVGPLLLILALAKLHILQYIRAL
jgi:hypothetical protein